MDDSSSPINSGIPPSPEAPAQPPQPTQYVNQEILGRRFHMSKKLFVVVCLTLALAIPVVLLQTKNPLTQLTSKTASGKFADNNNMELYKKTQEFLTAPEDRDAATYLAMAQEEKNYDQSYDHYVKAYNALKVRYTFSKDPKYYFLLSDLKKYIIIFPQYKASDLK